MAQFTQLAMIGGEKENRTYPSGGHSTMLIFIFYSTSNW